MIKFTVARCLFVVTIADWLGFQGSQLHQLSADEKRDLFERPGAVQRTSFGHI